jgi:o-succinylbenzoate synthase
MRIDAIEAIPYALRLREPYITARGRLERRELILVRVRSAGGPVGLGEATPLSLRGGADTPTIVRELRERCAAILVGKKLTTGTLAALIAAVRQSGVSPPALAGVDIALHDLAGKIEGVPVWGLLGAARSDPVRCNATLSAGEPQRVAGLSSGWVERGFGTVKLKVGLPGDRETVAAVRDAVGPGVRIRLDANGNWTVQEAVAHLDELGRRDIELVEQPAETLAALASVRRRTRIPVAADESVASSEDAAEAVRLGACELATVKLAKTGGIASALAVAAKIPTYISSALDGPVGIAAAAHLAQVLPSPGLAAGLAHGLATQELFEETIAGRGPELDGDLLSVPNEPGLGVELDELALARTRL